MADWQREIDPEFTGTQIEWTDKYGHVPIMTAERYATDGFNGWASGCHTGFGISSPVVGGDLVMPRLSLSGPRMLKGLVRPSISFNLNELKNNAPESTTFICVVQLGDKTKIVATPNPFAEVALIGLLLPNPNDIDVPFIVVAVGDGKTVVRAVRSQLTGRTKDGWYNVPAENLNRAIIAAAQRENVKTVPTSWEVLVAAMSVPAAKRDWFDRHPVLVWFFILLILGGFFMLFLIARAAP